MIGQKHMGICSTSFTISHDSYCYYISCILKSKSHADFLLFIFIDQICVNSYFTNNLKYQTCKVFLIIDSLLLCQLKYIQSHSKCFKMSSHSVDSYLLNSQIESLHLRKYQRRVINKMLDPSSKHRLLFVAGIGSGKTIAAILTGLRMLEQKIVDGVHIAVPKGVLAQFQSEVHRLVPRVLHEAFRLQTHQLYFMNEAINVSKNKLLIVDEAHQFSTFIEKDKHGKIKNGMLAHAAIQKARHAKGILLLTATPIQNNPTELINLLCMVSGQDFETFYRNTLEFRKIMLHQSKDYIRTGFKSLLKQSNDQLLMYAQLVAPSIMFAKQLTDGYPTKHEHIVRLTMDKEYLDIYNSVEKAEIHKFTKQLNRKKKDKLIFDPESEDAFYINLRRVVNGYTENVYSKKIELALSIINQCHTKNQRVIAYSNFINGGITLMRKLLQQQKVPFLEYTGKSTKKHRQYCMDQINGGHVNVLLLSRAGAEGLDLKCIRHVILLEPHFHNERLQQVIGRAVRYRSHETLPPEERNVTVHHLLLCKPVHKNDMSWEENHKHNFNVIVKLIQKYKPITETSKVVLHLNSMNELLLKDVMSTLNEPMDLFDIENDIEDNDVNIYVKVLGGLAFLFVNETQYDDIVSLLPPTTNISVDDILYKIAMRKQYVIQQHLKLIRHQQRSIGINTSHYSNTMKVRKTSKRKISRKT